MWNSLGKGGKYISLARSHKYTQDPSNPEEGSEWSMALYFTRFKETILKKIAFPSNWQVISYNLA